MVRLCRVRLPACPMCPPLLERLCHSGDTMGIMPGNIKHICAGFNRYHIMRWNVKFSADNAWNPIIATNEIAPILPYNFLDTTYATRSVSRTPSAPLFLVRQRLAFHLPRAIQVPVRPTHPTVGSGHHHAACNAHQATRRYTAEAAGATRDGGTTPRVHPA